MYKLLPFLVLACTGCQPDKSEEPLPKESTIIFDHSFNSTALQTATPSFTPDSVKHELTPVLDEVSGILESHTNPNMLWLHEDSGNKAAIYLYDEKGNRKQEYSLNGISAIDYEDMCRGFNGNGEFKALYIADIGDNNTYRTHVSIYRFPEPNFAQDTQLNEIANTLIEELKLTYPMVDGIQTKENAEALFVDPLSQDLFIFTKDKSTCKIMSSSGPLPFGEETELKHVGTFRFRFQEITAADISSNGEHIAIKSYEYIYYWNRDPNESVIEALEREPKRLTYQGETKGEAICWLQNGQRYVTVSELASNISPKFQFYSQ